MKRITIERDTHWEGIEHVVFVPLKRSVADYQYSRDAEVFYGVLKPVREVVRQAQNMLSGELV